MENERGLCGPDGHCGPPGNAVSQEEYDRIMGLVYSYAPPPASKVHLPWWPIVALWVAYVIFLVL